MTWVFLIYLLLVLLLIWRFGVALPFKTMKYGAYIEGAIHLAVGLFIVLFFPSLFATILLIAIVVVEFLYVNGRN